MILCSACQSGGPHCFGIAIDHANGHGPVHCDNYRVCAELPWLFVLPPFARDSSWATHSHSTDPGDGVKFTTGCAGELRPLRQTVVEAPDATSTVTITVVEVPDERNY